MPIPTSPEYERLIYFATLQDSLLQSYRSLFLNSQSVLFAIAVFVASGERPLFVIFLMPIALYVIYIWIDITRHRGSDVWFFHRRLLWADHGKNVEQDIFAEFKQWQKISLKKRKEDLQTDEEGRSLLESLTRQVMERNLPYSFLALWVILAMFSVARHFKWA